jgi:hypothetical protein
VQSVFVDGSRDVMAAATWGMIAIYRIVDGKLVPAGTVETTGDVRWVAVAGPTLAATVTGSGRTTVVAWRLNDDLSIGEVEYQCHHDRPVRHASLSRDGRFVAVGLGDDRIVVHALEPATLASFTEHTDRICLVRFAGDDDLLITADDDNRVVLRPRVGAGYARTAMPVDLADAPIAIADALA